MGRERHGRQLPGADEDSLFGSTNWNYPRAWQMPSGKVYAIHRLGSTYEVDVTGDGSFKGLPDKLLRGHVYLPSLMYAPGKVLSIRLGGISYKVDLNGDAPVVEKAAWAGLARINSTATVMADGRVLLSGGGLKNNDSGSELLADRVAAIWDPNTDKWSRAAVAEEVRLYHSTALLLQDATIFTGGGGAGAGALGGRATHRRLGPRCVFRPSTRVYKPLDVLATQGLHGCALLSTLQV
mgnify:CR=1 FL=1